MRTVKRCGWGQASACRSTGLPCDPVPGIDCPKSKQEVISYVREHGAPDDVIRVMQEMRVQQFTLAADQARAFGEAKDRLEGRR